VAKDILLALHIIMVISWMAGVLYLFRLVIYHRDEKEPVVRARFEIMERRLYRYITMPAMGLAFLLGVAMIALDPTYYLHAHWLHAKLTLVAALMWSTVYGGRTVKRLAAGLPVRSTRHFRFMNEVPTLLMIGIVFLVVMKEKLVH
jgi:putative membrane protein